MKNLEHYWGSEHQKSKLTEGRLGIYPLTIICGRYTGAWSGGKYTAWNIDDQQMPNCDDEDFWNPDHNEYDEENGAEQWIIGKGDTPEEAHVDLFNNLVDFYEDWGNE